MTDNSVAAAPPLPMAVPAHPARMARLALGVCVGLVSVKLWLITRININWDEFYFLSMVHALSRGELTDVFQTAFTHLFTWLAHLPGDEISQIVAARALMVALLGLSAWLIAKLAARFASPSVAWIAPLCFLAAHPVLRHGGSFRADSLLVPLSLGALLWFSGADSRRNVISAAVAFGVALAVSVKASLLLPVVLALELARVLSQPGGGTHALRASTIRVIQFGVVTGLVAGVALLLHRWSLPALAPEAGKTFAARVVSKTLLEVPLLPRWDYMRITFHFDRATWLLIAVGAMLALVRRRWNALACGLSLLPLLFYRNAFAYYFVVMLAPASVLAAVAVDESRKLATRKSVAGAARWLPLAACIVLTLQAMVNLSWLTDDQQVLERELVTGVHRVFPKPVAYIDHSGMIASFRKSNFFMSTWGVDQYRERGKSFMPDALARYRPPLLLINRDELFPGSPSFARLLPEDRELIQKFYLPYWGPVRVAGARATISPDAGVSAAVPFPGRYRLESQTAVQVDGLMRSPGESFEITGTSCALSVVGATGSTDVRLVWAAAQPPPQEAPPGWVYIAL